MNEHQSNVLELSVSELSFNLKKMIEERFGYVRVRGELGRVSRPASGHVYLDLKDDKAVLNGVIWKGVASRLKHQPEEGLEVIATGKLTTFPGSSRYQIVIDNIEPAGAGALMALLEERKKKLAAEGLFADERKQLLPSLPKTIGVVTSPTGSVIRDVLHRLSDRFPLHVLVWPVRVQGESCSQEVARAIRGFNKLDPDGPVPRPDLLIVARGGGSIEDLWGFNEEEVVRAAAESELPLISAVGHETDWTLIDHAADVRAPTPTAAAEMAVPVKAELEASISTLAARLSSGVRRGLDQHRNNLRAAERGLGSPQNLLDIHRQSFDHIATRLGHGLALAASKKRNAFERISARLNIFGLNNRITNLEERLQELGPRLSRSVDLYIANANTRIEQTSRLLGSLSYKGVLERGFAVVMNDQGKAMTSAGEISTSKVFNLRMKDGDVLAQPLASGTAASTGTKGSAPAKKQKAAKDQEQGDLF